MHDQHMHISVWDSLRPVSVQLDLRPVSVQLKLHVLLQQFLHAHVLLLDLLLHGVHPHLQRYVVNLEFTWSDRGEGEAQGR